jgi:hypothetical protein
MKFPVLLRSLLDSTYEQIPQSKQSENKAITAATYLPAIKQLCLLVPQGPIAAFIKLAKGSQLGSLSDTNRSLPTPLVDEQQMYRNHR